MNGLRLQIDLDKIAFNAVELVTRLAGRGISVTGVTKAMYGSPALGRILCAAGASAIGDSHIESIERMRRSGLDAPMLLLRSPAPTQVERVVRADVVSANTEAGVLTLLAAAARRAGRVHGVLIMVEMGDLREGVLPGDLHDIVRHVLGRRSLRLAGIGTNLACRSGVAPSADNMAGLSSLVESVEEVFGVEVATVSGGNSANMDWALGEGETGRVNDLRLGEAVLLGREALHRHPIDGLHTDAVTLIGEVIESKRKPSQPWGELGQSAFGHIARVADRGPVWQTILAVGCNDTEPGDLQPPDGVRVLAASSDHLVLETGQQMQPGDEICFTLGYAALVRSMTSPFVRMVS